VVPADQGHAVWVADFEAEEEEEAFEGVESSVDKVAHEEVVCVGHVPAYSEQFHQVVKLPVYVPAYCDWGVDLDDIGFFDEEFAGFVADFADLGLGDYSAGAQLDDGSVTCQNSAREGIEMLQYLSRSLIFALLAEWRVGP